MREPTAKALEPKRTTVYRPARRPGFTAWTTAFGYGDGRIGLTFKETLEQPDPDYTPPRLEFAESVASPLSYASVTWGDENHRSYRVYLCSEDGGQSFYETGRAPENTGCYANVGYPDGRILGFHVPNVNEEGTAWAHRLEVRESLDGGSTWRLRQTLLEGNAMYLWRVRRLRDGSIVVLACFYGSAWGPGCERATRNTMLPGESYTSKLQTFLLLSRDGESFSGPHYILPGIGAHEYDLVELDGGALLCIAGDVQGTPVGRQKLYIRQGRVINGPLLPIRRGAPTNPQNPQSGWVPETVVRLPGGLLVGARRNQPYTASSDEGENWFPIDGLPKGLYQPFLLGLEDGRVACFGHVGGDHAFGQADMCIAADIFGVENTLPAATRLSLERCLAQDGSHYTNRYRARLTSGGRPAAARCVQFHFRPFWAARGEGDTAPLPEHAAYTKAAKTDENGWAECGVDIYDEAGDIHFAYDVQAIFAEEGCGLLPCESAAMSVTALRPHRRCRYPYDAYLAEGVLFLAPRVLERFPNAIELLSEGVGQTGGQLPPGLPPALAEMLVNAHVASHREGALRWKPSVHAPVPLAGVRHMGGGDWYL